jgi:hypothetical protein
VVFRLEGRICEAAAEPRVVIVVSSDTKVITVGEAVEKGGLWRSGVAVGPLTSHVLICLAPAT